MRELLSARARGVKEVWVAQGQERSAQLDEIERLALRNRVKVLSVAKRKLDAVARTQSAQGVLALASPIPETSLEALCEVRGGREPFLLVLDGVGDPQNLGALLRSAECAGVTGVLLPRHRAAHITPTVSKVAAGAIEHLAICGVAGIPGALRSLASRGVLSIGLDSHSKDSLFDLGEEVRGPVALVLGAEEKGLGALTRKRCDRLVAIAQHGKLDSLNVAAAGAVACFEVSRVRHATRSEASTGPDR